VRNSQIAARSRWGLKTVRGEWDLSIKEKEGGTKRGSPDKNVGPYPEDSGKAVWARRRPRKAVFGVQGGVILGKAVGGLGGKGDSLASVTLPTGTRWAEGETGWGCV